MTVLVAADKRFQRLSWNRKDSLQIICTMNLKRVRWKIPKIS